MRATGKIISVLFALLLFFTGCTSGELDDFSGSGLPSSSSEESTPDALPDAKKLTGGKLVEPIVIPDFTNNNEGFLTVEPFPVYNNTVLFHIGEDNVNEDGEYLETGNETYYSYDFNTGQVKCIGRIDNFKMGTGDQIVMRDQYLYQAVNADGGMLFCGFSLNGEDPKIIEHNQDEAVFTPFWFLSKLNDSEIVIKGFDVLSSTEDEIAEYYIKKYNIDTGAYDELVRTSYNRTAEQGKLISSVDCNNGQIFTYISFPDCQIEIYDGNGSYIKSYDAKAINETIESLPYEDSFWRMKVYGDYFVIRTLSSNTFILKLNDDDALEKVAEWEQYYSNICMSSQKGEPEYLILTRSEGFQIFDFKTETVRSFTFDLDEQCKYLEEVSADEEGNVMFCLSSSKDHGEDAVMKRFYFSADELREQLAD